MRRHQCTLRIDLKLTWQSGLSCRAPEKTKSTDDEDETVGKQPKLKLRANMKLEDGVRPRRQNSSEIHPEAPRQCKAPSLECRFYKSSIFRPRQSSEFRVYTSVDLKERPINPVGLTRVLVFRYLRPHESKAPSSEFFNVCKSFDLKQWHPDPTLGV